MNHFSTRKTIFVQCTPCCFKQNNKKQQKCEIVRIPFWITNHIPSIPVVLDPNTLHAIVAKTYLCIVVDNKELLFRSFTQLFKLLNLSKMRVRFWFSNWTHAMMVHDSAALSLCSSNNKNQRLSLFIFNSPNMHVWQNELEPVRFLNPWIELVSVNACSKVKSVMP